ncbi:MAG: tyrosine-type recombinase/integrase [Flavobacteriaceae bacterium]
MSYLKYPKVTKTKDNKFYVSFFLNNKRYRLFNGRRILSKTNPNSYNLQEREKIANILAAEIYQFLNKGLKPLESAENKLYKAVKSIDDKSKIHMALLVKLKENHSKSYKKELKFAYNLLCKNLKNSKLDRRIVINTLAHYTDNSSYNSLRKNLNVLIEKSIEFGIKENPIKQIKRKKVNATLNKPFNNINLILDEIKLFSDNLHLCCLMTYGCLLRPHREIRELKWSDFSDDLSYIHLSGHRNKSGKNRIVPVPIYIRELLVKGRPQHNIFTATTRPLNEDYFKTLWGRFKRVSKLLEEDQTLYSFRHTGAIEIFKRTGSITKLQKAMGHSSINVSLTYLRGLEIAELTEEDMPMV